MLGTDRDRGIGGAAEIDRNAGLLHAANCGGGAGEAVEAAFMIDRRAGLGPDALQDVDVFVGAGVAVFLRQRVAVAELIGIVAAADHVHRRPAAGDLIERGEFARRQRGGDEAGAVGDEETQALGVRGGGGGEQEAVRPVRVVADQDLVETARLGRLREVPDVAAVEDRRRGRLDLRGLTMVDHADELDRHAASPRRMKAVMSARPCIVFKLIVGKGGEPKPERAIQGMHGGIGAGLQQPPADAVPGPRTDRRTGRRTTPIGGGQVAVAPGRVLRRWARRSAAWLASWRFRARSAEPPRRWWKLIASVTARKRLGSVVPVQSNSAR